jgi:hypothetical protein
MRSSGLLRDSFAACHYAEIAKTASSVFGLT